MKRFFICKKNNNYRSWKAVIVGIIIATFLWIGFFSKRLSGKMIAEAKIESDRHIYNMLSNIINNRIKNKNQKNYLITTKNKDNEILLTEFNLKEVYNLLGEVNKELNKKVDYNYIFFVPSFMSSKKFLINSWGSKIPVKTAIIKSIYSNIKTKVTDYGLNNALVEIYIIVNITQQIMIPFNSESYQKEYEILVSTYFINGKIPSFYGRSIELSSNIFDIKEKI